MADETKEEKEAREAEEKRLADEEAAKKAADAKPPETPPAKDEGEELAGKDVSKFSASEMIDYIDKLKDENAKRRISNRTLKDSQAKMEKKLGEIEGQLGEATKTLSETEAEKKKSADAEKSEVERLKTEVGDFKTKLSKMEGQVRKSDKAIAEKDLQIKKQSREREVGNLLQAANVKFSSDYERQGFMADLVKIDGDGDFTVNEEEVNYRVGQFIKKTKETKPVVPDTPGAGPVVRKGEAALGERIKALTAKAKEGGGLGAEDQVELDELLDLAGQAAAWDPRTAG